MKVLGCFDHAFVLNLPEDVLRMEQTREQLEKHNIPFERLEGATMDELVKDYRVASINNIKDEVAKRHYLNNFGCARSHLNAIRKARERGYESIVIFEDDLVLRPDFSELWADIIPQMQGLAYNLFYPYQWDINPLLRRPLRVIKIRCTACMHFYAVNSSFYDIYIAFAEEQLKKGRHLIPLDVLFHSHEVKTFATSYNLAGQRAGLSNITFTSRKSTEFWMNDNQYFSS